MTDRESSYVPIAHRRRADAVGGSATVNLDSTGTVDPESGIASYDWRCFQNDPNSQTTPTATCIYDEADIYTVSLTVTNDCGGETTETVRITVTN